MMLGLPSTFFVSMSQYHTPLSSVSPSENEKAGQRMKKRKTRELVFPPTAGGATGTSSRCYTDVARATITRDIFIPGPARPGLKSQLNKQAKHTTS